MENPSDGLPLLPPFLLSSPFLPFGLWLCAPLMNGPVLLGKHMCYGAMDGRENAKTLFCEIVPRTVGGEVHGAGEAE